MQLHGDFEDDGALLDRFMCRLLVPGDPQQIFMTSLSLLAGRWKCLAFYFMHLPC